MLPLQVGLFACLLLELITAGTPKKALHSSCFDLEDGTHYLQILTNDELSLLSPSEQDYYLTAPIIHAKCNSGYTIIDPSFDNSWITYFSSFYEYTSDISGPDLDDHVTWNEWFLPSLQLQKKNQNPDININNIDITYTISPDCNTCIINDNTYNNKVYYMSGDIFGCYWPIKKDTININKCISENNNKCLKCDSNDAIYYSSYCGSMIYDANTEIFIDHTHCFETQDANKIPSIGINGEYCICYKPLESTVIKPANWGNHYAIDSWDENNNNDDIKYDNNKEKELLENNNDINSDDEDNEKVYIELYEYDFDAGTYIINQPGTYIIMEDIKFNFNPGGIKHPNGIEFAWRPDNNNLDNNFDYIKDYYKMNWFAGIIIECNDVIIDLNDHKLEMDYLFYLQNRFFTIISLTNKLFVDNNDITFTDNSKKNEFKSVIKNSIIGLTSHIGIFGINNNNIHLINIHICDFETHGISINKYSNLNIKNIEIGPSIGINKELKLNTRYTNARLMLPIFYNVAKYNNDDVIYFNDNSRGPYNMNDIINRLIIRMDLAFEYIINGIKNIDISSNEFKEAKTLFINENGVSEYTTIYGLKLINSYIDENDGDGNILIENIYIHDLILNPKQVIKIGISDDLWLRNSFNIPIDLNIATNNSNNISEAIYYGDVYTDALIALKQFSNSWWLLGRLIIWNDIIEWTKTNKPLNIATNNNNIKEICGYDIVTGESKGVIGIEIAYSNDNNNINMNDIKIESLINMGELQHANCNNIDTYNGNNAKAISILNSKNINIQQLDVNKIVSFNGPSYGIYNDNNNNKKKNRRMIDDDKNKIITLNYAKFSHIDAGVKGTYDQIDISQNIGFNSAASSCSVYCNNNENNNCDNYIKYYDMEEQCINGHIKCINQMMIHHECQIDANYNTPIGTIYVNKNGEIDATLIIDLKNNETRQTSIVFRGEYFACAILVILAILAAIKCIYFKRINDEEKDDQTINENSPLISHNQQIDYNNL